MSTLTYLTSLVQQAISRLNNYEANAKKVGELPHQTNLNTASKIPVDRAGISEYITVDQIASAIQNSNYNQLLAVGTITVDGTDIFIPSGVSGQINGVLYGTSTDTTIPIVLCEAGFNRKDILVLTTSNTVVVISGEETDGAIVLAPPTPPDTVYITEFDVNDTAIGTPGDPVLGAQFKKKIENTRYKSTLSGENIIIPFQAAGQSHYSVTNATLVSVAGFTTAGLTTPMYEGQDVIFENQTGHDITLKDSFGVDTPFVIGADLLVPNDGKIWFRFRNNELELIDKNWFKINEVATAQNLGEFIDSLDSKTDVKDTDEFVLSDSDDGLKSKKTRFLDIKNKLKGYFDTLYLSLTVFNDFVTAVFLSLDNKLDKNTTPSSVYGTNTAGEQTMIPLSGFGTVKGTGTTNYVSKFTGSGTIGDSQIFDNGTNVGLGTNTPSSDNRLEVIGRTFISAGVEGGNIAPLIVRNTIPYQSPFNQFLQVWQNSIGNIVSSLRADGSFTTASGISATSFAGTVAGSVSNVSFRASSSGNTGMYFPATNAVGFVTNGVERFRILSTGEITIGAPTAGARFDIRAQGALATDIAFRVRNSTDTANLLQVNGQGTLSLGLQSSAPTGIEGAIYYNSTDKKHYGFNGTTWNALY